jgi:uncharacterized protein (TIGR02466 family)
LQRHAEVSAAVNSNAATAALRLAAEHQRAGRLEAACTAYLDAQQSDPNNPQIPAARGVLLLQMGHAGDAAASLQRALALAPDSAELWLTLGNARVRNDEFEAAREAFSRAAKLRPDLAVAHNNLGNVLRRQGRPEEAKACYRKAIDLEPDNALSRFNLGNVLSDIGALDEAVGAYRDALGLDPSNLSALSNLGGVLLRQQRFRDALACFERVVAARPDFKRGCYNVGLACQGLGKLGAAAAAYRRALQHDPGDEWALNNLCITLMKGGEPAQALAVCDAYLDLSPANRKPLAYKAAALIELGRRDEAAVLLDFDRLLFPYRVELPDSYASMSEFNAALAEHIRTHPTLRPEPHDKTTIGGSQTGELMTDPTGAAGTLEREIRNAVGAYISALRTDLDSHPYATGLPGQWHLDTWGVILRAQGHQGPHFHPEGYISGVYYVTVPDEVSASESDQGHIEFGRTAEAIGGSAEPLLRVVKPEAGTMLLFPSYFYHRTIPFDSDTPRICVAFDVIPES